MKKESKTLKNFVELASILSKIDNVDLMKNFMRDLCTLAELDEFILRREIAKYLHAWKTYTFIEENTGASSTTVARVAKYLQWDGGGYKRILEKVSP